MSATPAVMAPTHSDPIVAAKASGKTKAAKKSDVARRAPSVNSKFLLRQVASSLIAEGFDYREAIDLLRVYLLDTALLSSDHVITKAAAKLGISREHVGDFYARKKDVLS